VRVATEDFLWRRVTLHLPDDWVGKPVRLCGEAGPRAKGDAFGFSNPRALESGSVYSKQAEALPGLLAALVALLLFLTPGLPIAARLVRAGILAERWLVPTATAFSCLAGYLTFWAYFLRPIFGVCFAMGSLLAGVTAILVDLVRGGVARQLLSSPTVRTPVLLMGSVCLFYLSLSYAIDLEVPFGGQSRVRFFEFTLAIDNEIPYYFADRLYNGLDPRELVGEWHSSDRPPLQAGLILMQLPLGRLLGKPLEYSLILGSVLQCCWVPVAWSSCRTGSVRESRIG